MPEEKKIAEIVEDKYGKKIVKINQIRFKGKRQINWDDVKMYLREFRGGIYSPFGSDEKIHIGLDFPNEYTGSEYTYSLKGTVAKAKANASQGIPEMIEIAVGPHFRENNEEKHERNAKYGWYRYDSRFALPVFASDGSVERYNAFHISLLVRHDENGKKYLYDAIDIKKETSNPLGS